MEPILASGGTVTVGLLCLLFSDLNSNKALGPIGASGIIFSIIAALTLPARRVGAAGQGGLLAVHAQARRHRWPPRNCPPACGDASLDSSAATPGPSGC